MHVTTACMKQLEYALAKLEHNWFLHIKYTPVAWPSG